MHLRSALATFLVILGSAAIAAETGTLLTLRAPEVVFTQQAGVYLRQEGVAQLSEGENRLLFDFGRLEVDPATVDLRLIEAPVAAEVVGRQLVGKETGQMAWLVRASQPTPARLRLAYAVKGLETEVTYIATVRPAEQTLSLEAQVAVRNGSRAALPDVSIVLASGHRLQTALEQGQTVQQRLFRFDSVPYDLTYLYDSSRFKDSVQTLLTLTRSGDGDFSGLSLPAGTIKVYGSTAAGAADFIAQTALPYTPRREKVELDLGAAPDVTVIRTKLRGEQVNVRNDVYRKLALFDMEEEYEFEIENHRPGRVVLVVREHVPGEWQVLKASADYVQQDAGTLEFALSLPPRQTTKLNYAIKRLNVEP